MVLYKVVDFQFVPLFLIARLGIIIQDLCILVLKLEITREIFFKFYFIFKLYNIVLVLPNIEMNLPQVYSKISLVHVGEHMYKGDF